MGRVVVIKYLKLWTGYQYLLYRVGEFLTSHFLYIWDYIVVYSKKAKEYNKTPLQEECLLQSYFITRSQVDYFIVTKEEIEDRSRGVPIYSIPLLQPKKDLFIKLKKDYKDIKVDIKEQASIIYNIRDSRSERVLQLYNLTGFLYHIPNLKGKEIWSLYKLLLKKELDSSSKNTKDPNLIRILGIAQTILRDMYQLYSNTSPNQKMIQQQANILNEFYTRALDKANGFRYFKNILTLVIYFTTIK